MGFCVCFRTIANLCSKKRNINVVSRLSGEKLPELKLAGKSQNGVSVYRGTDNAGVQYTVSFKKDGSPLKFIKKNTYKKNSSYMETTGRETVVKNFKKNDSLYLHDAQSIVNTKDLYWLNRHFTTGDKVNIKQKAKYNDTKTGYKSFVDGVTLYNQPSNPNWYWTIHERPGITKSVTYNRYSPDWQNIQTYFELTNFKFPGGAVHNGRIGYDKGCSATSGNYVRKTMVNPYGDVLDIDYGVKQK